MRTLGNKSKLTALVAAPVLAAALALAIGIATQPAGAAPAGNSNNEFAVGGASFLPGHLAFAAQRNPQNGSISGHVVQEDMWGNSISGAVLCLYTMNGNMAHVEWRVDHSDNTSMYPIGQHRQFDVTDNGPPVMGMSQDQFLDQGNCGAYQQPQCTCTKVCSGGVMPAHGNIVVKGPTM
jgi:hypothetical protein